VSDGGGKLDPEEKSKRDWLQHAYRVLLVIDSQVRSLRKRQVIASYKIDRGRKEHRDGTYWGIRSHIEDYNLKDALSCRSDKTLKLANVPTRLKRLSPTVQKQLVNWGFAICDTAMRKHVAPSIPVPEAFPYPEVGVG
jgi:NTE family protein